MPRVCPYYFILILSLIPDLGIRLAGDICSANLNGVENGSCAIDFRPGVIRLPGAFSADPGTAGSTTLLLQIGLPCLIFSSNTSLPSALSIKGGTNATNAPQIDYTNNIFFPFLRRHFGLDFTLDIRRRGYFPRGGGQVLCSAHPIPGPLRAITLTNRGSVMCIEGMAHVGGLPARMARSMVEGARAQLVSGGLHKDDIEITAIREANENVIGAGAGIVLWATTTGGCVIGGSSVSRKGVDPLEVGELAAKELLRNLEHGGCVDEYLQVCWAM
jgi:RNA 3'-terminal phosphate cyclase (ATP)